jgi:HK97 family phage major capsid protein
MKKSLELKETRSGLVETLEAIKNTAEGESRNLNEAETIEVDNTLSSIEKLDTQIERAEKVETELRNAAAVAGAKITPKADKDLEKFTFTGAMRAAYTGELTGIYKEMDQEARSEARYTGQVYKGVGIPTSILTRANTETADVNEVQTMSFTDQLEANLVLASAGANFYGGINNMKFPVFSGIDSTWVTEAGSGTPNTNGTTDSVTLSPKKLISVVNMSQESLIQGTGLEAALQKQMAVNLASTLEYALLATSDVSAAPESIFADAAASGTGAADAAAIIKMETDLLGNKVDINGARMAYLMDAETYSAVKSAVQVTGVSALYDPRDKRLNGYYAFVSPNVGAGGASSKDHCLFGDFSKVHIAQFGGLDILFDPYTNAASGLPRMVVTGLYDGNAVQNDTAFCSIIEA